MDCSIKARGQWYPVILTGLVFLASIPQMFFQFFSLFLIVEDAMLCDREVVPQLFPLGNVFIGLVLAWQQAKGSLMHNPSQYAEFAPPGASILPLIGQFIAHQIALSSCPGPLRLIPFCDEFLYPGLKQGFRISHLPLERNFIKLLTPCFG